MIAGLSPCNFLNQLLDRNHEVKIIYDFGSGFYRLIKYKNCLVSFRCCITQGLVQRTSEDLFDEAFGTVNDEAEFDRIFGEETNL